MTWGDGVMIATGVALVIGAFFSLLAALGVARLPDVFTRMHAATKAGTLGVLCVMLAAGLHFGDVQSGVMGVLVMLFLFLTAPVGAHVIARAAKGPLWEGSVVDERPREEKATRRE